MPGYEIKHAGEADQALWDAYVREHDAASLFHLFAWRNVFRRTYGHATHYLMALERGGDARVRGVLPLVHFKHAIFGNHLVSLPFVDGGGVLASNPDVEGILLAEAARLGREVGAATIELRQDRPLADSSSSAGVRADKVRMLLSLPDSSRMLLKSFKSKLRSQINIPLKEGLASSIGGQELIADFYKVFLVNMRDLGSPVHSMNLMRHVLDEFPERSRIVVVYRSREPVASALVVGCGDTLRNPWASSLRRYARLGPNMLLYLRMLELACDSGYRIFDFGRSTIGEGTFRFKEQWGARPAPLHWYGISVDGRPLEAERERTERFRGASRYWSKLPLFVTRIIGPSIRKHISL
jgi:FemAB-related protein (PEP-CTERM system-associated)